MHPFDDCKLNITRRHFFAAGAHAVGWAALASLLGDGAEAAGTAVALHSCGGLREVQP